MSSIFCLSGWGQKFDSIESFISPEISKSNQLISLDYSNYLGYNDFKNNLNIPNNPDVIIGWSLGGQIALRLCAENFVKPKKLILI
ncbi:MAG: alpha/beta hydrolase, partial [Alphaproteobacteria bacterium]